MFNSGGNLVVRNCVLKDFILNNHNEDGANGNGILIAPATGTITFTIVDTIVSNSPVRGHLLSAAKRLCDRDRCYRPRRRYWQLSSTFGGGINASLGSASGGSAAISISNSVTSNNTTTAGVWRICAGRQYRPDPRQR